MLPVTDSIVWTVHTQLQLEYPLPSIELGCALYSWDIGTLSISRGRIQSRKPKPE